MTQLSKRELLEKANAMLNAATALIVNGDVATDEERTQQEEALFDAAEAFRQTRDYGREHLSGIRLDPVKALQAEVERHREDLRIAATDFPIPLPEPGTTEARLLTANRLLKAEVERLKALRCDCDEESGDHDPDCPVMLRESLRGATDRVEELEAEVARLTRRIALADELCAAADCIRHWHDSGQDGMVVSASHVRDLWGATEAYRACPPRATLLKRTTAVPANELLKHCCTNAT